jgi:signal transduction histidine kinase
MYWAISKLQFFKGLRSRVTAAYSILYGIFISLFIYYISTDTIKYYKDNFDSALMNYALDISSRISINDSNIRPSITIPRSDAAKKLPFFQSSVFFSVRTLEGSIIYNSSNLPMNVPFNPELANQLEYTHRFMDLKFLGDSYRAINMKIFSRNGTPMILQLATPAKILVEQTEKIFFYGIMSIPFLIIVSALISYYIAGQALKPLRKLTNVANQIAANNLSERVPEVETRDEIQDLSKTLNNLLSRLEISFKAQEHFVANASHQLNTPLSIIKGELELYSSKVRTIHETTAFHNSFRDEIDRLISLVKNILLISRVEAGTEKFHFSQLRIDEILLTISSRLNSRAKEKKVSIRFDIEDNDEDIFRIQGNKALLDSLFENLLDNAIKYSAENTQIKIFIKKVLNSVVISIQDYGPGIPHDLIAEIFNTRFKRDEFNNILGNGLGLSIAKEITQLHFGNISYSPGMPEGSIFEVHFPLTPVNP